LKPDLLQRSTVRRGCFRRSGSGKSCQDMASGWCHRDFSGAEGP
jgi:hypothetical protein